MSDANLSVSTLLGSSARYDVTRAKAAHELPMIVRSLQKEPLESLDGALKHELDAQLPELGAVLFRGFRVGSPIAFRNFAASFGTPLASYEFGSTPRTKILSGIYSSTEYPAHQSIPLHNEQSYTRRWPQRLWFHCITPASSGGQTPLADSREVFASIPEPIRNLWAQRELLYVRNYSAALDVPWPKVFGTSQRAEVDAYCREQGIGCEWLDDDDLRTTERCQATTIHPRTGRPVWFNQAHLFHVSSLPPELRESLIGAVGEARLPRNVYFGDGSPLPDADLAAIRDAYRGATLSFEWQAGDVLMVDNLLMAHGRQPFSGPRKVIVAMA